MSESKGSVLQLVPEEIARKATLIPLEIQADVLTVAMAFPDDVRTLRDIATRSGKKFQAMLASSSDIMDAIDLYYRGSRKSKIA